MSGELRCPLCGGLAEEVRLKGTRGWGGPMFRRRCLDRSCGFLSIPFPAPRSLRPRRPRRHRPAAAVTPASPPSRADGTEPLRIDLVGYREWARVLFEQVQVLLHRQTVAADPVQIDLWWTETIDGVRRQADMVFLIGWSSIVPRARLEEAREWIVLHPSPLPRYRGGSPIQHQIMDGQEASAVSLFRLLPGYDLDAGPLCWQQGYSLLGTLDQVLARIARVGARGVVATILARHDRTLTYWEQPASEERTRTRRQPDESEITMEELTHRSARWLHDKVRALQPPYPVPYIRTADGGALVLRDTRYVMSLPEHGRGGEIVMQGGPTE